MYEKMDPGTMDKTINKQGKRVLIYFIGFCSIFVITFIYSIFVHYFFTALVALLFVGFLLVYYMQVYVFIRILRMMHFNDNFLNDFIKENDD